MATAAQKIFANWQSLQPRCSFTPTLAILPPFPVIGIG